MRICPQCSQSHRSADWLCPRCGWKPERRQGIVCLHPATSKAVHYPEENFSSFADSVDRHFWSRGRDALLLWVFRRGLAKLLPEREQISDRAGSIQFLEVGCGLGQFIRKVVNEFPQWLCTGVEYYGEPLQRAKARTPEAEFVQLDAVRMPYEEEFDVVGMFDVLEHIEADVPFLLGCVRALKPGGLLVVQVPQHAWLWSDFDKALGHQRRYVRSDLLSKARSVGLEPVWSSSFVFLLLPVMCISRWLSRNRPATAVVSEQLLLPRWQNALCAWIMAIERMAIRAGIRFPVGGSLLIVFRRVR